MKRVTSAIAPDLVSMCFLSVFALTVSFSKFAKNRKSLKSSTLSSVNIWIEIVVLSFYNTGIPCYGSWISSRNGFM